MNDPTPTRVAIVGGGLAGLAAALRLAEQGIAVEIFESRQALGGRAASYRDPSSGELVDHCQHVAMACCTNFHDFCERTGIANEFDRYRTLHFFGPNGRRYDLQAARWLPAPLHLALALLGQGYLTWRERLSIGKTMLQLARERNLDGTIGAWLRAHGQSQAALDRFWSVVLVSALGETLDKAALAPAKKVFVDGFLAHRSGYQVDVPKRPLRALFDERVAADLERRGVLIHRSSAVNALVAAGGQVAGIQLADQSVRTFSHVILAVPWRRIFSLVPSELQGALRHLDLAERMGASPITGVHLWFDRAISTLPHAVLVDRMSQWVFRREVGASHYYQVVISASRDLSGMPASGVVRLVVADLAAIFPEAMEAALLAGKVVTEREAVFSYGVGTDALRPGQTTPVPNLFLAGDWTQTTWPATLESAVRSGYLAASGILAHLGRTAPPLAADLPRSWLVQRLV